MKQIITEVQQVELKKDMAFHYCQTFNHKSGEIVLKNLEDTIMGSFPEWLNPDRRNGLVGQVMLLKTIRNTLNAAIEQIQKQTRET